MAILYIGTRTRYKPVAWTFGSCPFCQQHDVLRVEQILDTLWLSFIPLSTTVRGHIGRCNFCRRIAGLVARQGGVSLKEWSPAQGVPALLKRLRGPVCVVPAQATDTRLRSLLTSAADASSLNRVRVGGGPLLGLPLGFIGLLSAGGFLYDSHMIQPPVPIDHFLVLCGLGGLLVGPAVGGVIEFLLKKKRVAFDRIAAAHRNYNLDLRHLEDLSRGYPPRIQQAVRRLRRTDPDVR